MKTKKLLKNALLLLINTEYADVELVQGVPTTQVSYLHDLLKGSVKYKIIKAAIKEDYGNLHKTIHVDDLKAIFGNGKVVAKIQPILEAHGWVVTAL